MSVAIRLYGQLRDAAGTKTVAIPVEDGGTLDRVLQTLVDKHPATEALLYQGDDVAPEIVIRVNKSTVDSLDTELADGDRVAIATQVVGG